MPTPTNIEFFWQGTITWLWIVASVAASAWLLRLILLRPTLQALHRIARALEYLRASDEANRLNPPQ